MTRKPVLSDRERDELHRIADGLGRLDLLMRFWAKWKGGQLVAVDRRTRKKRAALRAEAKE